MLVPIGTLAVMRIDHTQDIPAPVATVWALTTDVERLPEVTPTMTSVERLDEGPLSVGSRVRIRQPGQPAREWTVTELDRDRRFAWSTSALGSTMTGVHELDAIDGGTRNTLAIELDGWSSRIVGVLLGRVLRRAMATENEGIRAAASGRSSPSTATDE
jgi:uncharacterized membrane protein